jgi:hypothetical protein
VRSSIDPAVLEMICDLELGGKDPNQVSDEELREFLEGRAGAILKKGDSKLKTIFKELRLLSFE